MRCSDESLGPVPPAAVDAVGEALGCTIERRALGNINEEEFEREYLIRVMAAASGSPLLVEGCDGNPAVIGAVGMLAGFCGTLLTPMAANFNIVPAALLELDDQNGVIRQQVGTAIPLWVCNVAIIYVAGFWLWS